MAHPDNFDSIITEPIPLISEEGLTPNETERSSIRTFATICLGATALTIAATAVLAGFVNHQIHEQRIDDILRTAKPPVNEQNIQVTALANDILDGADVTIDCNTDLIMEKEAEETDDGHTLAYVNKYTINGEPFVPPYIVIQGATCADLLTFPRMEKPAADDENNITYQIRAEQFAKAVGLLLHEVEHINYVFNEGEATCYAVQKLPAAIEEYYQSPDRATEYAQRAALLLSYELMPEYTSDECTPGGEYDLSISSVYTTDELLAVKTKK